MNEGREKDGLLETPSPDVMHAFPKYWEAKVTHEFSACINVANILSSQHSAACGTAGEGSNQLNREKSRAAVLTAEQPAAAVKRAAQPPVQIGSASCGKRSHLWDDASNESQKGESVRKFQPTSN